MTKGKCENTNNKTKPLSLKYTAKMAIEIKKRETRKRKMIMKVK